MDFLRIATVAGCGVEDLIGCGHAWHEGGTGTTSRPAAYRYWPDWCTRQKLVETPAIGLPPLPVALTVSVLALTAFGDLIPLLPLRVASRQEAGTDADDVAARLLYPRHRLPAGGGLDVADELDIRAVNVAARDRHLYSKRLTRRERHPLPEHFLPRRGRRFAGAEGIGGVASIAARLRYPGHRLLPGSPEVGSIALETSYEFIQAVVDFIQAVVAEISLGELILEGIYLPLVPQLRSVLVVPRHALRIGDVMAVLGRLS
jgi:hypothetical protein